MAAAGGAAGGAGAASGFLVPVSPPAALSEPERTKKTHQRDSNKTLSVRIVYRLSPGWWPGRDCFVFGSATILESQRTRFAHHRANNRIDLGKRTQIALCQRHQVCNNRRFVFNIKLCFGLSESIEKSNYNCNETKSMALTWVELSRAERIAALPWLPVAIKHIRFSKMSEVAMDQLGQHWLPPPTEQ